MPGKPPRDMCGGWLWKDGSIITRPWCYVMLSKDVSRLYLWNIVLSMMACEDHLVDPDTIQVFGNYFGVFGDGTRLAMPKTICMPDSSSLKPGLGATEGVLDKGVSGQPDYILSPDCWTTKIQDRRLCPVSGWDSPWRGRQAWRFGCRSPPL